MITAAAHRKRAREFLARAERAESHAHKCRYLRLAVRNTVCAWKLEAGTSGEGSKASSSGGG
jgi:hypothetical protein